MNDFGTKDIKQLPEGIERINNTITGYEVLVRYQEWKVAVITYAERFDYERLFRLERHLLTDEVFVLLKGQATLYIGEKGIPVKMEPHEVYNVKCGCWHNISMLPGTKILICENEETGLDNTEYLKWSPLG